MENCLSSGSHILCIGMHRDIKVNIRRSVNKKITSFRVGGLHKIKSFSCCGLLHF